MNPDVLFERGPLVPIATAVKMKVDDVSKSSQAVIIERGNQDDTNSNNPWQLSLVPYSWYSIPLMLVMIFERGRVNCRLSMIDTIRSRLLDHGFSYANSISRNSSSAAVSRKLAICWSKATFAGVNCCATVPLVDVEDSAKRSSMQKLCSLAMVTIKCLILDILIDNGRLSIPHFFTISPNAISIRIRSCEAKKLKLSYLGRCASAPL